MSVSHLESNPVVEEQLIKVVTLTFELDIVGDATPACKVHSGDLAGIAVLRSEGKTAVADAVEACVCYVTAVDATNAVIGVILDAGKLSGDIQKVLDIQVIDQDGTGTAIVVAKHGTRGLTAGGNVAFSVTGTGIDLASESPTYLIEVKYKIK